VTAHGPGGHRAAKDELNDQFAHILAVEMEAAALYAFARARGRDVLCFAHLTNQMGQIEGDFEKGPNDGATEALGLIVVVARALGGPPPRGDDADG